MSLWQLRDPTFRAAIHHLVDGMRESCALAGTVGTQIHLAAAVGLEKLGPPAHAIHVVPLRGVGVPARVDGVPVERVSTLGFDASIEAGRTIIAIGEDRFPVASPEHLLGTHLASPDLSVDAKWACFILMRTFEGRLDLEEVRGLLKRSPFPDRQELLAELAYLAA